MKILVTYYKANWTHRTLVFVRLVPEDYKHTKVRKPDEIPNPALQRLPSAVCFHDVDPSFEWNERNCIQFVRSYGRETAAVVYHTNTPQTPEVEDAGK